MRGVTARRLPVALALGLVALIAGAGLAVLNAGQGSGPGASAGKPSPVAAIPSTVPGASPSPSPSPVASPSTPGAPTAGPSASPSGPSVPPSASPPVDVPPHDPAKFGFVAKGMRGEVMAFATIPQMAYVRDTMDFSAVSTLVFLSLQVGADGTLQHDSRWRAWNVSAFDAVRDRARAAGTKVVVCSAQPGWPSPSRVMPGPAGPASSARRQVVASSGRALRRRRISAGTGRGTSPASRGPRPGIRGDCG